VRYRYLRKSQQQISELEITPGIEDDLHSTYLHSIQVAIDANRILVASNEYTVYPRLNHSNNVVVNDFLDVIPCTECGSTRTISVLEDHDIEFIQCPNCNGTGLLTRDFLEKRYQSLTKHQHTIHQSLTELYYKIEAAKL
jgi:Zn-finger nucleic acid-binding protein